MREGLSARRRPIKTDEFEGSGGVYFLVSANGQRIAVFKPQDEEQGMPLNPKGRYVSILGYYGNNEDLIRLIREEMV